MNTYRYAAVFSASVALVAISSMSVLAAPAKSPRQNCVDKLSTLKKAATINQYGMTTLETEFYGPNMIISYDGGLQDTYNRLLLNWNSKIENYDSWRNSSNGQKTFSAALGPIVKDRDTFIDKMQTLEKMYEQQSDSITTAVYQFGRDPKACRSADTQTGVGTSYKSYKNGRADIASRRRELTTLNKRVTSALKVIQTQRDSLAKKKRIVRVIDNGAG